MFTVSINELSGFAQHFWTMVNGYTIFLFYGEMGAGKTTIIEALCAAKGVTDRMGSPTFSIINQYVYNEGGIEKQIFHVDLYRLKDEEEIIQAGVEECLYSGQLCFIEWPQKAPGLFDENAVTVFIEVIDETHRSIKISLPHAV